MADVPLVLPEREPAGLHEGTVQGGRTVSHVGADGWLQAMSEHFHCEQIRRADNPRERMCGFRCNCRGHEEEWMIPLTDLRIYDGEVDGGMSLSLQALNHAEENWDARRALDVRDWRNMGIAVSGLIRRREAHYAVEEKSRNAARKKARTLLRKNLTRKEWQEFSKEKTFHVTGSDGRTYRISHQIGSNVTLVVGGQDVARYCLVPKGNGWIPEPDMMLAVKLMLETNARSFLRRANMTDLRPNRLRRAG